MKKKGISVFLSIMLLSLTACGNGQQLKESKNEVVSGCSVNENSTKKREVDKDNIIEGRDIWKVTDIMGERKQLNISDVPEFATSVNLNFLNYPGEYMQMYRGHLYFLRYEDSCYNIYKDEGEKIGSFTVDKGRVTGCAKYGKRFFVRWKDDQSDIEELGIVNFRQRTIDILYPIGTFPANICKNNLYFSEEARVFIKDLQGKVLRNFKEEEDDSRWFFNVDSKKIYYLADRNEEEKIRFICQDQQTDTVKTIFEYKRNIKKSPPYYLRKESEIFKQCGDVFLKEAYMDDIAYSVLYVIPKKKKHMIKISNYALHWAINDKYVFYTDKKGWIHRWNRVTEKDKIISKFESGALCCTDKKLFVQEFSMEYDTDAIDDYDYTFAPCVYVMDIDGRNMKHIY